jgi:hypothetical protein
MINLQVIIPRDRPPIEHVSLLKRHKYSTWQQKH